MMLNGKQTFYLLGTLLSKNTDSRKIIIQHFQSHDFNWQLFIALGSNHLVLQTIYLKLIKDELSGFVPREVNKHLKLIYELNYQRNTEIIQQVHSINDILNKAGIIPLYMKGVGNILDGLYNNLAERILHDIDILVPEEQWEYASKILIQNGYKQLIEFDKNKQKNLKHYPPLFKPGTKVSVEIHRYPVAFKYSKILCTQGVWDNKKPIADYSQCYVMSDQHKILNNFVHSQLEHNGHVFARIFLRNLYDILLISEREDISKCFESIKKYRSQAAGYLRITQKVFGVINEKKSTYPLKSRLFEWRFETNLQSRLINLITFLIINLFRSYIKKTLKSLVDIELRNSLMKKLFNRNWYKKHFKFLTFKYETTI